MNSNVSNELFVLLRRLEKSKIHYTLNRYRDEAIMVSVSVPGQRWEIEFMEDGTIEIEKFISNGMIYDESAFKELFDSFSD